MSLWQKIAVVLILLVLIAGVGFNLKLKAMEKKVHTDFDAMQPIVLSQITDGVYEGAYGEFTTFAAVAVTVKEAKIVSIELTDQKAGKGHEAADIPNRIVKAQQPAVDVVTGASTSSRVISLATYMALTKK